MTGGISVDYRAEFIAEGTVQENGGKKMAKMSVPAYFQGHTFAVDFSLPGKTSEYGGPYRVEFVLGSEFLLHRSDMARVDLQQGYSNLSLGKSIAKAKSVSLYYENTKSGERKDANLTFVKTGAYVQRLVVEMHEDSLDLAVAFSGQFVNLLLDVLSLQKQLPIQVHHIEIFHVPSGDLLREYVTIPHTINKDVEANDFELFQRIPDRLKPILRLFREAINSSNPHYRLLCLYRMREGIKKVRARNSAEAIAKGRKPKRARLRVPDNELTQRFFPALVGKRLNAFLDYVRDEFRTNIAHLDFDDYGRMLLDPGEVKIVHRIDSTNAVLEQLMRRSIQEELKFMLKHELK